MARTKPRTIAKEVASQCLGMRVRRLSRQLTSIYDDALRAHEITIGQLSVLVVLELASPATNGDIERALLMERSTVSRTIRRMLERGWVNAEQVDDRRSRALSLTPSGRAKLTSARAAWKAAQRRAGELVAELDLQGLHALGEVT